MSNSTQNTPKNADQGGQVDAIVSHEFEDLDERLRKAKTIDDLLDVIFADENTLNYFADKFENEGWDDIYNLAQRIFRTSDRQDRSTSWRNHEIYPR